MSPWKVEVGEKIGFVFVLNVKLHGYVFTEFSCCRLGVFLCSNFLQELKILKNSVRFSQSKRYFCVAHCVYSVVLIR